MTCDYKRNQWTETDQEMQGRYDGISRQEY